MGSIQDCRPAPRVRSGYTFEKRGMYMKLSPHVGVCALLMALGWQANALAGDTLFIHGHIYTGNPRAPWATALSVSGTRIEAVGTDAALLKRRAGRTQVIDLHGRTVIPGIVDS